jgi:hypothetical protein
MNEIADDGRIITRVHPPLPARGGNWARWSVEVDGCTCWYSDFERAKTDQDGSLSVDLEAH